jgi:hypothetical protein
MRHEWLVGLLPEVIMQCIETSEEERGFGEFRRKVRASEVLSASTGAGFCF